MGISCPLSMNCEWNQAVYAVVLMFWMPCLGMREPTFSKLSRPNCDYAPNMGLPL
jgi:hypothetical protein